MGAPSSDGWTCGGPWLGGHVGRVLTGQGPSCPTCPHPAPSAPRALPGQLRLRAKLKAAAGTQRGFPGQATHLPTTGRMGGGRCGVPPATQGHTFQGDSTAFPTTTTSLPTSQEGHSSVCTSHMGSGHKPSPRYSSKGSMGSEVTGL